MKKLPAWAHHFVAPFLITMLMTAIVSGISTVRAVGFAGLGSVWLGSWFWSWMVAFPALLVIMPIVRRFVVYIVETPETLNK